MNVALVGATASGKSAVAMEVARALGDVEIISVDSMQVYRGLDVGTAKPTPAERGAVPHHLLDLVEVEEEFSVAEFQRAARDALDDIAARGRHALLVGGTGLYLRAVIDDLELPGQYPAARAALAAEPDTTVLHARLAALDPVAAARTTTSNRRRIERALEVTIGSGRPFSTFGPGLDAYPPVDTTQIGLDVPLEELDRRIEGRVDAMLGDGLVAETAALRGRVLSRTAAVALGYAEVLAHLEGACSLDEARAETIRRTRRLARRQLRWFRRDPRITWVRPGDAVGVVMDALIAR
ncbi:MAG TPA: tRNA (adenosine(37)-N6)-dimethylallyltransferase MiaA [Acidimicrobiales bacterium]|nr:tRNA (adenosine(37)-N6)-dimethylallyltransferase MiaA [Acidimicrobiales bacterium]